MFCRVVYISPMPRLVRSATRGMLAATATCIVLLVLVATALGASVGNPPAHAGTSITVKVHGITGKAAAYLSPARKLKHGDYSLGTVRVKHGKVTIKVSSRVKAGSYYVVLCVGRAHRKCTASHGKTKVTRASEKPKENGTPEEKEKEKEKEKEHGECEPVAGGSGSEVSKCGGSVTTTGPEGTKFTLGYSAQAATPGTKITLTPLPSSSLTDLNLRGGKLLGAVRVEPATTNFYRDTDLVITPPSEPGEQEREAVTFTGEGEHEHALPLAPQSSPIVLAIAGGGEYALIGGAKFKRVARRAAFHVHPATAEPPPLPYSAGYQEHLAELLQQLDKSEDNQLDEPTSEFRKTAVEILKEWYAEIKANLFEPAEETDADAEIAVRELLTWGHTGALIIGDGHSNVGGAQGYEETWTGMSEVFGSSWEEEKIFTPARKFIGKSYDRHQEACRNEHKLSEIEKILERAREYVLIGGEEQSWENLLSCETFKIKFESTMFDEFTGNGHGSLTNQYVASFKIKPETQNTATFPLKGEGKGKYELHEGEIVKEEECAEGPKFNNIAEEKEGTGAPMKIANLVVPEGFGAAGGSPPTLKLEIEGPSENYKFFSTATCNGMEPPEIEASIPWWWLDWLVEHEEVGQPSLGGGQFEFELEGASGENFGEFDDENKFHRDGGAFGGAFDVNEHTKITLTQVNETFTKLPTS